MIGGRLSIHFRLLNQIHVSSEEESTDSCLDLGGCEVLGRHRSRPRLVNDLSLILQRLARIVSQLSLARLLHSLLHGVALPTGFHLTDRAVLAITIRALLH